jgi:hypothetical protein
MQLFLVTTQLYCATYRIHVSTAVGSDHQADSKNKKINITAVKWWAILDLTNVE